MTRVLLGVLALLLLSTGCSDDVSFYRPNQPPLQADRLAITGRVCTADPISVHYPVRVVLLVDQAAGPLFAEYDPGAHRLAVLSSFVQTSMTSPAVEVAIIGFAGTAKKLAPQDGSFTRNPGELLAALTQLAGPQPCDAEDLCRDGLEALRAAGAVIEGDMAGLPAGTRIVTQYVIVMIDAGPQLPPVPRGRCCAPSEPCPGADEPSAACAAEEASRTVTGLRDTVRAGGAAGLRVHSIHLGAEPDPDIDAAVADMMKGIAFAGGGRYLRRDAAAGFAARDLDVLDVRTVMRAKHLLVANVNTRATPDGPAVDSDGDGLVDVREEEMGTSPRVADTDGDGVSDLVEVLVARDPLVPGIPIPCEDFEIGQDTDFDGLFDCDEALLGTDPSLVDSDGDALPDRLELVALTDYLVADAQLDSDGDGVSNGDEVRYHTDPRSTDLAEHFNVGYRYDVEDEGVEETPVLPKLKQLTGVELIGLGKGTTRGVGTLRYGAAERTLSWQDAADGTPGPDIDVAAGGELELPSASWAPLQGADGRLVRVRVSLADLPPQDVSETARVTFRARHCLRYTVRNIRLMGTLASDDGDDGHNEVLLYFAQAPEGRPEVPGPFRLAQVPVTFRPPTFRDPADPILEVLDVEFVEAALLGLDP